LAPRTREQAILARAEHAANNVAFKPGTLGWAAQKWVASREFSEQPEGTQKNYKRLVELLLADKYARGRLADLRSKHVIALARQIQEARGMSGGRAMLPVISNVWEYAIDLPEVQTGDDEPINPARVAYRRVKYKTHKQAKRWPDLICSKFLVGAPSH